MGDEHVKKAGIVSIGNELLNGRTVDTNAAWLGRELVDMAARLCEGRIVFTLEGGYQLDALAYGVLNAFYALLGEGTIIDPFGPSPRPERPVDDLILRLRALHGLN